MPYDIRFGVWVVFEGDTEYIRRCFTVRRPYRSGQYACLYKRWHLIGLEVGISVASIGVRREPTGCPTGFRADAVATAKRDLKPGEPLDGEGGYTVVGRLLPAADSPWQTPHRPGARLEDPIRSPRASWCAGPMWWWMRPTAPCACVERWSRSIPRRRIWWCLMARAIVLISSRRARAAGWPVQHRPPWLSSWPTRCPGTPGCHTHSLCPRSVLASHDVMYRTIRCATSSGLDGSGLAQ